MPDPRKDETKEERKARWKSITIGGAAPGNKPTDPNHVRPMVKPVWEGGKIYQDRPGGFRVPLVHAHSPSQPVTNKQFSDNKAGFTKQLDRLKNDPSVFKE